MNIFESLENLSVSEECFNDIMSIVEEILDESIYHAIQKHSTKQDKNTLMNKAYDNQENELNAAAKREEKPEDVEILTGPDGKKFDEGIAKSRNRIYDKRFPKSKQAENIMNKGVAKMRAGDSLKDEVKGKKSGLGTSYANKEKEKLSSKLIKQGEKEFKQGVKQMRSGRFPLKVTYADGGRKVELADND